MKRISSLKTEVNASHRLGVTIGNFDGVHRGHQFVLQSLRKRCQSLGLMSCVVTFSPHPRKVLFPGSERFLINSDNEKYHLLEKEKIDYLYEIKFDEAFSKLDPKDFLKEYIFSTNKVELLLLGHDFRFGRNKVGDIEVVQEMVAGQEVKVENLSQLEGVGVSSTLIRENLREKNFQEIAELLGRPYFLSGEVMQGEQRGKSLGFPTANLSVDKSRILPPNGVYITKATVDGRSFKSMTNIGLKPTFEGPSRLSIETHLLNFSQDIYSQVLRLDFLEFIRPEKKFSSVSDLVEQLKKDKKKTQLFDNDFS